MVGKANFLAEAFFTLSPQLPFIKGSCEKIDYILLPLVGEGVKKLPRGPLTLRSPTRGEGK